MIKYPDQLKEIAREILSAESNPGAIFDSCSRLKELLLSIAYQAVLPEESKENLEADKEVTQQIERASKWVGDIFRTKAFCLGLYKAVKDKIAQNPGKTIKVLYGGSGPFATFMLPLTTLLKSEEVQFTLVEINKDSCTILEALLDKLALNDYVKKIENRDLLNYKIAFPDEFDIVVCETMHTGLKNDSQVAIAHKIMPQLDAEVTMIPEEVALNLYLVNDQHRSDYKLGKLATGTYYNDLGPVFVLSKETIEANKTLFLEEYPEVEFPEAIVALPKGAQRKYDALMLNTKITVYDDQILKTDHSALTVLLNVMSFKDSMLRLNKLGVQYICDQKSGIEVRVIN